MEVYKYEVTKQLKSGEVLTNYIHSMTPPEEMDKEIVTETGITRIRVIETIDMNHG